jgi:hypothetical protein
MKNASTRIATAYEGTAVPPTKLNAPDDGQIGRNMLCSGSVKSRYKF